MATKKVSLHGSTMIAVASTAPAYSLAVTVGLLAGTTGIYSAVVMLMALIPMVGVAYAFKYLNAKYPDAGTVFAWTTKAFGAKWGFISGWAVCVASIVVMGSLAQVATIYGMQLFGIDEVPIWGQALIGSAWIALLTFVCYKGIDITARMQKFLVYSELAILLVFAAVALFKVFTYTATAESIVPTFEWFNPFGAGDQTFIGIAAALFIYWGWDTSLSITEETEKSTIIPGKAALYSIALTGAVYAIVVAATIAFAGLQSIAGNEDDVFAVVAHDVLGPFGAFLMIFVILISAVASTQTTILPTARTIFSMGRAGALPDKYGKRNDDTMTPTIATIATGAISIGLYLIIIFSGENVLYASVEATAIFICFYYFMACIAAVKIFAKAPERHIVKHIVVPTVSALMIAIVGVYSVLTMLEDSEGAVFGLGIPLAIVAVCSIAGLVVLAMMSKRDFFKKDAVHVFNEVE